MLLAGPALTLFKGNSVMPKPVSQMVIVPLEHAISLNAQLAKMFKVTSVTIWHAQVIVIVRQSHVFKVCVQNAMIKRKVSIVMPQAVL